MLSLGASCCFTSNRILPANSVKPLLVITYVCVRVSLSVCLYVVKTGIHSVGLQHHSVKFVNIVQSNQRLAAMIEMWGWGKTLDEVEAFYIFHLSHCLRQYVAEVLVRNSILGSSLFLSPPPPTHVLHNLLQCGMHLICFKYVLLSISPLKLQ